MITDAAEAATPALRALAREILDAEARWSGRIQGSLSRDIRTSLWADS